MVSIVGWQVSSVTSLSSTCAASASCLLLTVPSQSLSFHRVHMTADPSQAAAALPTTPRLNCSRMQTRLRPSLKAHSPQDRWLPTPPRRPQPPLPHHPITWQQHQQLRLLPLPCTPPRWRPTSALQRWSLHRQLLVLRCSLASGACCQRLSAPGLWATAAHPFKLPKTLAALAPQLVSGRLRMPTNPLVCV